MASMFSPSNMEVFLYCHWAVDEHPRAHAPAVGEAIDMLLKEGMIQIRQKLIGSNPYELTAKGIFFMGYVLNLPFPTEKTVYAIEAPELD